jgi:hypothetical protein
MLYFLLSVARAVVEMLLWCFLAQGLLYLLAGEKRQSNPIYRFFALICRGPQHLVSCVFFQRIGKAASAIMTFFVLTSLWIGLAMLKQSIGVN